MKDAVRFILAVLISLFYVPLSMGEEHVQFDFSGDSLDEIGVTFMGAGFGAYPEPAISLGVLPKYNTFKGATDGWGLIIEADPGEGVMILGPDVTTENMALIRCSVRTDAPHASITLATIDAGENSFVSTLTPAREAYFENQYRRLADIFIPPSTGFQPLIQVINTSDTEPLTVYLDNFEYYLLDPERYYHTEFLDGDVDDPEVVSLTPPEENPTSTPEPTSTSILVPTEIPTTTPTPEPTQTSTPVPTEIPTTTPSPLLIEQIEIDPSRLEVDIDERAVLTGVAYDPSENTIQDLNYVWSSGNNQTATVDGSGTVCGLNSGNSWIFAQFGDVFGEMLLTVNPVASEHNSRPYEWYQTQMGTGPASDNNCGPTSTHMAIKWYSNQDIPVDTIRDVNRRNNGWWYTSDIQKALKKYNTPFVIHSVSSRTDIDQILERGNIVLLCMEMRWIDYSRQPYFDRFYNYDSGHFLIVKGWSEDGEYFITYDPNSWAYDIYSDGTMFGRNRYYDCDQVMNAALNWWAYCFEIGASSNLNSISLSQIPDGHAGPRLPDEKKILDQ